MRYLQKILENLLNVDTADHAYSSLPVLYNMRALMAVNQEQGAES